MRGSVSILLCGLGVLGMAGGALAAPTVYVPLGDANEILIVDAANDKVMGSIGDVINPHGVAATPDGRFLVAGSNQEAQPGQKMIPPKPAGMSVEAHKRHHSMPASGAAQSAPGTSQIYIIDAQNKQIVRRVDVKGAVHHSLITPDGRYAVSTHTTAGGISVIDLTTGKLSRIVQTGPVPNYLAVTKDGKRIYVSNAGNNTISEIDTDSWIVVRNIPAGEGPEHLVLSPDERTLYVNDVVSGTVSVIGLEAGKVVKTYAVGAEPHGIDLSDDGKTLFVASQKDGVLTAIDLRSGQARQLSLAPAPYHVTAIRDSGKLYVSSRELPKIWVIDQDTLKNLGQIAIRGVGHQMAVVEK